MKDFFICVKRSELHFCKNNQKQHDSVATKCPFEHLSKHYTKALLRKQKDNELQITQPSPLL